MNKKVMALAVAGALVAPAAALAQVQIGGSVTIFYYQHDPENDNVGQKGDILETSEPEIYFRGEEKLGGGLSAWFQCTSSMDGMLGGSGSSQGLCARNSGIGFRGGFGNAFAGNWDTPQKLIMNRGRGWFGSTNAFTGGVGVLLFGGGPSGVANPTQSVASPSTTTTPVVGTPGVSTVVTTAATGTAMSNSPAGFARRQSNSLNYHSPDWGGFSLLAAFSANNESTGIPESSPLTPRLWSLAGQFATGPFYIGAAFESHKDYNPANQTVGSAITAYSGGSDTNITVVAGYRIGGVNARVMYSKSEYDTTNSTSLDVDGWGLFADWNIAGPHTLRAQYVSVGDTSGNAAVNVGSYKGPRGSGCSPTSSVSCASSTGASVWGLFYSYALSKRTEVSFGFSVMDNDSNAAFSKGKTAASAGGTQTTTGFVLKHSF